MSKVKVLGISGSLRDEGGNSDIMLRELLKSVNRYGGEPKLIRLAGMNIKNCEGCASKTKEKELCTYPCIHDGLDDTSFLLNEIAQCDALAIATGVYWLSKSSWLQLLFEKMTALENNRYRITEKFGHDPLEGKPFAVLVSYESYGASSVAQNVSEALSGMGFAKVPYGSIPKPNILNGKLVRMGMRLIKVNSWAYIQNTIRLVGRDLVLRTEKLAGYQFDDGEFEEPRD